VKLVFSEQAWEDYLYWQKIDKKLVQRINELLKEITRTPHTGTGKPEALRHALAGYWSRRINLQGGGWFSAHRSIAISLLTAPNT
jgi:toxin YoeB